VKNRTLVVVLVVVVGAWLFLRQQAAAVPLPWNQGQAGSIFSGLRGGGGQ
jgi:hypothetical protein